jgi:ribosome-binding factor A
MTGSRRPARLAEQIREEVTLIIGELEDPRVAPVTVTEVKLSPDLRNARIFVSIAGTNDEKKLSMQALKHASGFVKHELGAVLRMKRTPDLHFVQDDTDETAARIEELLSREVSQANERDAQEVPDSDAPQHRGTF